MSEIIRYCFLVDDTASGTEQSKVNTDAESEVAVGKSSKKKKDKEKKEKRGKTKEKKEKEKKGTKCIIKTIPLDVLISILITTLLI